MAASTGRGLWTLHSCSRRVLGVGFTWEGRLPEEGRGAGRSRGEDSGQDGQARGESAIRGRWLVQRRGRCPPRPPAPCDRPALPWTPGPSAGIGRTGCFIATRIGCQQLKARGEVDILGIVCQLRLDRWVLG